MALMQPPVCDFGWNAPDFKLPATDDRTFSFSDVQGPKGTLILFICNHCPYVTSVIGKIVDECTEIQKLGIGIAAISSNDAAEYPADSFENMITFAKQHQFTFPYLYDETQATGRAYNAMCTPDFFGFNADNELQYRGRLGQDQRDLFNAMKMISETNIGPADQVPSMGCSIKWRAN